MQKQLHDLETSVLQTLNTIADEEALIEYRNSIFGKNGQLTTILKWLKDLSPEDRAIVGSLANGLRDTISQAFDRYREQLKEAYITARLENEYRDVTWPLHRYKWSIHPITKIRQEVENIFRRMGFDIYEAMEITTERLNFDVLNIAKTHPARDMQDTFWLEWEGQVLATQTSCMQNLLLQHKAPPIKAIIPGRVFRNEDVDATHDNTFYQIEWVVVGKNIGMSHLKHTIQSMLEGLFNTWVQIRMRPWYFPFVEPGVEIDFSCPFCHGNTECRVCKGSGWIEFMGAGLIHPNVIREGGLDPSEYSGFAFGFWLNRLVMIKYGVPDMRYFMHPDIRFLEQFS